MYILAINGSPRKSWSTATLLEGVLKGAQDLGAETELVHLYDLEFKGCRSCFECKRIGGKNYGRCAVKDGLSPILDKAHDADAIVLGTPVYLGTETGEMRSCFERLLFPYLSYTPGYKTLYPRKIKTSVVYTMNHKEDELDSYQYTPFLNRMQNLMGNAFGECELLLCTDTLQFDDYSKYLTEVWDADAKMKRHKEVFPEDCERAYALGKRLMSASA